MNNPAPMAAASGQSVSPKSSMWSGMSVLSDEEDSAMSRFSSSSYVSGALPTGSNGKLKQVVTSFDMSPVAGATEAESPSSAQQPRSQPMRRNASARKLNFDDATMAVPTQPPVLLSQRSQELAQQQQQQQLQQQQQQLQQQQSAELAAAQKRIEELQKQVVAVQEAASASAKEAEELKGQLAERHVELEEIKAQVRARDAWLEKEEERRLELEARLREAQARGAMAEADLKAAAAELENRDHVIAEMRSKSKPPLVSGELGRVMGASGKQADVIAYLSKELEHDKEANEAHQQRVRFLANQLAETERRGKGELELREAHCEALRETVAALRRRAAGDAATGLLARQVEELKREYFQALGVGMKLNLAMQGQNVNLDLASLYDEARDALPYADWNRFLSLKLSLQMEASAAKRQSLMAELAQLHRKHK